MTKKSFDIFLSQYVSEEWVFLAKNYFSIKTFKSGERIFNENDPVTGTYFINQGKVKVTSRYNEINERILRLSNEGDLLGHRAIHTSILPISAVALTNVEITFLPQEFFLKLIKANSDFAFYLLTFMSRDLSNTEERMKSVIHHDVIVRIGKLIFMLIEAYGYDLENSKKLQYTLSRADIADFVGTSYESVIRNLGKLEELKLIELENKDIIVPNEDNLRKFILESTK